MRRLLPRELAALGALTTILTITAVWWALALWPLPGDAPTWLLRTRAVCFGSVSNGMPTTAGWMVLIGQPIYMLATLWLVSGHTVAAGLRRLAGFPAGRHLLRGSALVVGAGLVAAGVRVAGAATVAAPASSSAVSPADMPRLDRAAPPLALVDQTGQQVTLAQFRGRPVFVTFAFGHCETVCPLIVHDLLRTQREAPQLGAPLLIVTVDPWRDTPARLAGIAKQWRLGANAHVLSGPVADVERTLDQWSVGRERSLRTGDVTHPALVYVIDRTGRIAFAVSGGSGAATLTELVRRL